MRTFQLGLALLVTACPAPTPSGATQAERSAGAAVETAPSPPREGDPVKTKTPPRATDTELPPSSRTFAVALESGGPDVVLGAWEDTLWARRPTGGGFEALWTSKGPGSVQAVTVGGLGGERSLFVGRGRARGNLIPFVRVDRVDPETGEVRPLFREESERADIAQLLMAKVDGADDESLVVGYFETKHRVASRYLLDDGSVRRGPTQVMATSRIYADLDGDGSPDEVVGRVYRDDQGSPGDLTARIGERTIEIPTEGGVRSLASARLKEDGERAAIYFADGWSANYGTEGRAKLARAHLQGDRFVVERLAESPGEYTLFSIVVVPDGERDRVFVQGSRYLSVLAQDDSGAHGLRRLLQFDDGAGQGALGRGVDGDLVWYWPGDPSTRAIAVDLEVTKPVPVDG